MPIEAAADRAIFFDADEFGVAATYTPDGGAATTINGIFDNPQLSQGATDMLEITTPQPEFECRSADVPNVAEGDTLVVNTVSYIIRAVMNDGTGISTLMLERS